MVSTAEERTRIWIETFSGLLVDTTTATKIVGHKLEKMLKQYYIHRDRFYYLEKEMQTREPLEC